ASNACIGEARREPRTAALVVAGLGERRLVVVALVLGVAKLLRVIRKARVDVAHRHRQRELPTGELGEGEPLAFVEVDEALDLTEEIDRAGEVAGAPRELRDEIGQPRLLTIAS